MIEHEYIEKLLETGYECEHLDFKKVQYIKENFQELIVDILSMANSSHVGDKYIILGVKDKQGGDREYCGISEEEFIDSSVYKNIVLENIEPEIIFDYFPIMYKEKLLGIIKINASNIDRPYMLKKQYKNLNQGFCKIRKGSNNYYITRNDFDRFYTEKELFEVEFMDNSLMAVYDERGCASISVTIRNLTKKPIVIQSGQLSVIKIDGKILSRHMVYGFGSEIVGADFQLALAPMEEKLGDLYVGFNSSDCLRLEVDEYGHSEEFFIIELTLIDTYKNEYCNRIDNGRVYVQGEFLWKVKLNTKTGKKQNKSWNLFGK